MVVEKIAQYHWQKSKRQTRCGQAVSVKPHAAACEPEGEPPRSGGKPGEEPRRAGGREAGRKQKAKQEARVTTGLLQRTSTAEHGKMVITAEGTGVRGSSYILFNLIRFPVNVTVFLRNKV